MESKKVHGNTKLTESKVFGTRIEALNFGSELSVAQVQDSERLRKAAEYLDKHR